MSIFGGKTIGSRPTWGAQNVNHFREFHRGGFFFGASFGPGFGGNSLFLGHKLMKVLNENSWKNSSHSCPDPLMFRFGFDGLCGFLNELKPMFKITPRFAQNNYLV